MWRQPPPAVQRPGSIGPLPRLLRRHCLQKPVIKIHSRVEGLDTQPLIPPMGTDVVAINRDPCNSVGGQPHAHGVDAVRRARSHVGNDRRAGPHLSGDLLQRPKHILAQRRRREALPVRSHVINPEVVREAHGNLRVGKYLD